MRWQLIALDLDGTLYPTPDAAVAAADAEALHAAAAKGALVMVATGRHRRTALPMWERLGLPPAPSIVLHGAELLDPQAALLRDRAIPRDVARACVADLTAAGVPVRVDTPATVWLNQAITDGAFHWPGDRLDPDLHHTLPDPARQLVVVGTDHVRQALRVLAHRQGAVHLWPLPDWENPAVLHVLHPEATKGLALAELAARLGIPRDAVLVAGDSWADLSMLTFAGCGVAMDTAPPGMQALADRVARQEPGWLARLLAEANGARAAAPRQG